MPDKVQKQISWFLVAKSLIKFVNDENSYKLSEKVMAANDFKKYPLLKGDTCDISIEDGVVTYLRKVKKEAAKVENHGSEEAYEPTPDEAVDTRLDKPTPAPAPEVKKEVVTPSVVGEEKVLTVFAVAANKKVVKFLEAKDAGWFQIDEAIQAQDYAVIGLQAKLKVSVKIVENKVVSLAKVGSEPAEQPKTTTSSNGDVKVEPTYPQTEKIATQAPVQAPKKEWKSSSSYDNDGRQKSIEAQAAVNAASNVAARIGASLPQAPTANVVNAMIRAVAESNFALIQELKNK